MTQLNVTTLAGPEQHHARGNGRFLELDGLRGIAAFEVLLIH